MKILILSISNNTHNGCGSTTHDLCTELQGRGIDFELLLPRNHERVIVKYAIKYILPPYVFRIKNRYLFEYLLFSYVTDATIVHSFIEFPYAFLAAKIARQNKVPYVIELHGTYAVQPLTWRPEKWLVLLLYRCAALLISRSVYTQKKVKELSGTKTPFVLIHPGIHVERFADVNPKSFEIRDFCAHKKILLTVGALSARKGQDVVLRALAILKKERNDIHYCIVGGNGGYSNYKYYQSLIVELGLVNYVTMCGEVSESDLVSYYQACDIYVHTPRSENWHFEGFGIVYLEAGACRKPVIGSRSGGVPDAVVDGYNGLLVPENDPNATAEAIRKILNDNTLAKHLGDNGYEFARKHDWSTTINRYIEIYQQKIIT